MQEQKTPQYSPTPILSPGQARRFPNANIARSLLPEIPSEGPKRVSAAPTKTPLGARMGCTTNASTEDHESRVLGPDGFTAVSAMTSHDRLPWLFVDTAVPFRYVSSSSEDHRHWWGP